MILVAYEIFCDECADWIRLDRASTKQEAKVEARELGWRVKATGHFCPNCVTKKESKNGK